MAGTFQPKARLVTAVQFDGKNLSDLHTLVQDKAIILPNPDGTATLYTHNREGGRHINPWWWICVDADGIITSHSNESFRLYWEEIQA